MSGLYTRVFSEGWKAAIAAWFPNALFVLVFSIVGVVIVPFAFLVAIGGVITGGDFMTPVNFFVFWIPISLLVWVSVIYETMWLGTLMMLTRSDKKTVEESLKHPFQEGRFRAFVLYSFWWALIAGAISAVFALLETLWRVGNVENWESWIYLPLQLVVMMMLGVPYLWGALAISRDEARDDAFMLGWRRFVRGWLDGFVIHLEASGPIVLGVVGILLCASGIGAVPDGGAGQVAGILGIVLVIISFSLALAFLAVPVYCAVMAAGYDLVGEGPAPTVSPVSDDLLTGK